VNRFTMQAGDLDREGHIWFDPTLSLPA
jgi:hypothetical protein